MEKQTGQNDSQVNCPNFSYNIYNFLMVTPIEPNIKNNEVKTNTLSERNKRKTTVDSKFMSFIFFSENDDK